MFFDLEENFMSVLWWRINFFAIITTQRCYLRLDFEVHVVLLVLVFLGACHIFSISEIIIFGTHYFYGSFAGGKDSLTLARER